MGKLIEDYDIQINTLRMAYVKAVGAGDWTTGAHYVYMMNNCIRPKYWINDLRPFYEITKTIKDELKIETQARDYCRKYAPLVERAITMERDALMRSYDA